MVVLLNVVVRRNEERSLVESQDGSSYQWAATDQADASEPAPQSVIRLETLAYASQAQLEQLKFDEGTLQAQEDTTSWLEELFGIASPIEAYDYADHVANKGNLAGNVGLENSQNGSDVSDPVNVVTGEFYDDTTDLHLPGPITLSRTRPYLHEIADAHGNTLSFSYYQDPLQDYGQLRSIRSSNGNWLNFEYDALAHITAAYTNDARRVEYHYDQFADLIKVTRPDGSAIEYEYEHRIDHLGQTYSNHLITRIRKPEGRILENDYDSKRRVTHQRATVGPQGERLRNASFVYGPNHDPAAASISSWTRVYDVFNQPSDSPATRSSTRRARACHGGTTTTIKMGSSPGPMGRATTPRTMCCATMTRRAC